MDECLAAGGPLTAGVSYQRLRAEHSLRLALPRPFLPFADGAPTPSGKVELYSETLARQGLPPLPTYVPLAERPDDPALAGRYPLRCHVPPNRFFLNSSFGQSALLRKRQAGPAVFLHPDDAGARGIGPGELVAVWNDRGRALFTAVLTDDTPCGQVVIEGDLVAQVHARRSRGQRAHVGQGDGPGRRPRLPLHGRRGGPRRCRGRRRLAAPRQGRSPG